MQFYLLCVVSPVTVVGSTICPSICVKMLFTDQCCKYSTSAYTPTSDLRLLNIYRELVPSTIMFIRYLRLSSYTIEDTGIRLHIVICVSWRLRLLVSCCWVRVGGLHGTPDCTGVLLSSYSTETVSVVIAVWTELVSALKSSESCIFIGFNSSFQHYWINCIRLNVQVNIFNL